MRWYARFLVYRDLGTDRTLDGAYRVHAGRESGRAGAAWRGAAEQWRWAKRAEAWDLHLQAKAAGAAEEALQVLRLGAKEAAEKLVDLVRSGAAEQARLAANSILNRVGVVWAGPEADEDGVLPIQFVEIVSRERVEDEG
ncbi:MAG TPA: hypothetical protein PL105_09685 [Caldilineaceae bacterium]|nr:hypothetical protein [Caldilineaceae bacterium]